MIEAVLFDLDGTLADTALDLIGALNRLRQLIGLSEVDSNEFRQWVSLGSRALLREGLDIQEHSPEYPMWKERFLNEYRQCIAQNTTLFSGSLDVLIWLDTMKIKWGIVTNKPQELTHQLLPHLALPHMPEVVVCGDTLDEAKPSAKPVLYALNLLDIAPQNSLFVGDSYNDIEAGRQAQTLTVFARYGYLNTQELAHPNPYQAHYNINQLTDLIEIITSKNRI